MEKNFKNWLVFFFLIFIFHVNRFLVFFTHPSMLVNDLLLGVLLLSSVGLFVLARKIQKNWPRRISTILTIFIICLSSLRLIVLIIGMSTEDYQKTADPSLELIRTEPLQSSEIKVYLTNCGATCAYGVEIRQEMPLIFGITLTRSLLNEYRCTEANIEKVEKNIQIDACNQRILFEPKRWVYF